MTKSFRQLYRAPARTDPDGTEWYKCLSDIIFTSRRAGWAVGSGQILSTTNAGKSWTNHYASSMASASFTPHRLSAPTQDCCWIIDTVGCGQTRLFHTGNGGTNWQATKLGALVYPKDIFFLNTRTGWIITDDGKILSGSGNIHITNDGGKTWTDYKLTFKGRPEVIRFGSLREGWLAERVVSKDQSRSFGRLHRSHDGGRTWAMVATFDRRILDVTVLDAQRIFISGEGGLVVKTLDGGQSWQRSKTRMRAAINSISSDGKLSVLAAGDSANLLKSDDGGASWIKLKGPADGSNCVRAQILPNGQIVVASNTSIFLLNGSSEVGAADD